MSSPTREHTQIQRWAGLHDIVPLEELPDHVDGVSALLRLIHVAHTEDCKEYRRISWADFFAKFDSLGLVCMHDEDEESTGDNEIVQLRRPSESLQRSNSIADMMN